MNQRIIRGIAPFLVVATSLGLQLATQSPAVRQFFAGVEGHSSPGKFDQVQDGQKFLENRAVVLLPSKQITGEQFAQLREIPVGTDAKVLRILLGSPTASNGKDAEYFLLQSASGHVEVLYDEANRYKGYRLVPQQVW